MSTASLNYDVLVIGSGISGFAAAVTLKRRRKNVAILRKNPGATSVSSGAWDFGPVQPGQSLSAAQKSEAWEELYSSLLLEQKDKLVIEAVRPALDEVVEPLRQALHLNFRLERPFCLPTSSGEWKFAFGAHQLQTLADLEELKGKRVGLVQSEHWRYRADLICEKFERSAEKLGARLKIVPFWVDLPHKGSDWPLPRVAAQLANDNGFQEQLKRALGRRLEGSPCEVLLFPPLFLNERIAEGFERELHLTVAECLSVGEPTAGYRLTQAMEQTLRRLQIGVHEVQEIQAQSSDNLVRGLNLLTPMGWTQAKARHYVLATGKFFGGGIEMGYPGVREPIFGLPVFHSRTKEAIRHRSQIPWENRGFLEEQAWARLGVWVDAKWRPIDVSGKPVFNNLSACGSVIGGVDFALANIGLGFMAYSGKGCADEIG